MNKKHIKITVFSAVIFCALLFSSCNDDDSHIGLGIIPGSDIMGLFVDTLEVNCYTVRDDKITADERSLSPLGSYADPEFGFSKAGIAFHTRISSNNVDFSPVQTVNSLELHLRYHSHYGDTATIQNIKVYRLLKDIYIDSTYYGDFNLTESEIELLTTTQLHVDGADTLFKINLPIELANEFISSANVSKFVDNEAFITYFKGFYITSDEVGSDGAIVSFNLLHATSGMYLNYNDSLSYEFLINSKSAIVNMFSHDYSTASGRVQSALADTTGLYDFCFVQSLGGLKTKIMFPQVKEYFDTTNIAINKAELIISLVTGSGEEMFAPPPRLTLVSILENGRFDFITDYKLNNTHFGGLYSESTYTYRFNIPFHVQELVNGNEDFGIYLFANDNRTTAYRAVLHGNGNSDMRMKMQIYYSKF